jgi:hypothetical protein
VPVTYVKLASVDTRIDGDLMAKKLSRYGTTTLIFFQQLDSNFCRLAGDAPTSISVERKRAGAVHHLVNEMELTDFLRQNNTHS